MAETDPHAGLADLDEELDVAGLIAETGSEESDPLADASKSLREGSDETDDLDEELDDDLGDDETTDEETEDKGEKETDADADADEEEDDDEEETDADEDADKGFTLEVPTVGKAKGRKGDAKIVLEGLPQEFHDTLKGHINRSQQLDEVQESLTEARQYETAARFVQDQPLAAMLMLEQTDQAAEAPTKLGEKFVSLWMRQHPEAGIALVKKLNYHEPDRLDPDALKDKAEAAQLRAEKAVDKALVRQKSHVTQRQWGAEMGSLLRNLALEMNLNREDEADFVASSVDRIRRVSRKQARAGNSPFIPRTDVLTAIQPVLKRFNGDGRPTTGKGKKKPDPATKFAHRAATRDKQGKVGGGREIVAGAGVRVSAKKMRGAHSVKEASAVLRGTK